MESPLFLEIKAGIYCGCEFGGELSDAKGCFLGEQFKFLGDCF